MRAGPLSNPQVIELLNKYFVPVTSANELQDGDRYRIYHEFAAKKLGIGDVFVYVCAPDGTGFRQVWWITIGTRSPRASGLHSI